MIWGKLPSIFERNWLRRELAQACMDVPDSVINVIQSFPKETPYYPMLLGGLSAFLGANKDSIPAMSARNLYHDNIKALDRGCIQTLAAYYMVLCAVYCHRNNRPFIRDVSLDRPMLDNLFLMMGLIEDTTSTRSRAMLHAINQVWISGVDHEMNNSNSALLHAASTLADPVSCFMSALASSYGILHFGAVESVYTMLQRIGKPENVTIAIAAAKATRQRIMGVGHRVYKSRDPRIEPLKGLLHVLAAEGMKDPLLDVAYEMERQIHQDKHFVDRKLCVNVDLYWPLSYTAMGIQQDAMLPIFLCSRIVGMMTHWRESMLKPIKLWRPLIVFNGVRAPKDEEQQEMAPVPVAEARKLSWPDQIAISLLNLPGVPRLLTAVA